MSLTNKSSEFWIRMFVILIAVIMILIIIGFTIDQNEDDIKKKTKDIEAQEDVVKDAKENTRKY